MENTIAITLYDSESKVIISRLVPKKSILTLLPNSPWSYMLENDKEVKEIPVSSNITPLYPFITITEMLIKGDINISSINCEMSSLSGYLSSNELMLATYPSLDILFKNIRTKDSIGYYKSVVLEAIESNNINLFKYLITNFKLETHPYQTEIEKEVFYVWMHKIEHKQDNEIINLITDFIANINSYSIYPLLIPVIYQNVKIFDRLIANKATVFSKEGLLLEQCLINNDNNMFARIVSLIKNKDVYVDVELIRYVCKNKKWDYIYYVLNEVKITDKLYDVVFDCCRDEKFIKELTERKDYIPKMNHLALLIRNKMDYDYIINDIRLYDDNSMLDKSVWIKVKNHPLMLKYRPNLYMVREYSVPITA